MSAAREKELALLIEEQRKDDTFFQASEWFVKFSLDKPVGEKGETLGGLFGVDEDGEIVSFLPRERDGGVTATYHGTPGGYTYYSCRCARCRAANAKAVREYMARHPEKRRQKHVQQTEYRKQRLLVDPEYRARHLEKKRAQGARYRARKKQRQLVAA